MRNDLEKIILTGHGTVSLPKRVLENQLELQKADLEV